MRRNSSYLLVTSLRAARVHALPQAVQCDMRLQTMLLPSAVHQASANLSLHRGLLASK